MNKYTKFLILLLILLGLGAFYYSSRNKPQTMPVPTEKTVQESKAGLSINDGTKTQSFDISQFVGKTALEATQSIAKIETSGTGTNAFVTTINGKKADTKKHEFWELIINGKSAEVGAGSYTVRNGDKIEWKINTY